MAQQQAPQEWFTKDYYQVLGVPDTATSKEIKAAYRRLSKQFHPDASGGDEERFKEISTAFDVLGDAAKRKDYDEIRRLGPIGNVFNRGAPNGGFSSTFRVDDLGDILGGIFGRTAGRRGAPGGGTRTTPTGPRRGADLETQLHLSFEDAIRGVTTTVNVTSDVACDSCDGTGAAPGTSPVICSVCGGRGVRDENQGFFSFSQPCRACAGTGMRIETPCPECQGSGVVHKPRQVKVRIPPGVEDAQRIRLKARGGAGFNGGQPGDLYVVVHVAGHLQFGRKGKHLTLSVPITFAEAALGATITVPTLDAPVSLKIPPGTRSGQTFRVRGHGTPAAGGAGDLLVTVDVHVPATLTDDQRAAVEAYRAATTESPRTNLGV